MFPKIEELLLKAKAQISSDRERLGDLYCNKNLDYVCLDNCGQIIKPNALTQVFPQVLADNGLKKIRFHDLRHSCASLMLAEGVPMKQIQEWLGHSTFSTTADTYSHLDYNSKIASADKIGKALDFDSDKKMGNKDCADDDLIQEFMRDHGLRNNAELLEYIENRVQRETNKEKKSDSEM